MIRSGLEPFTKKSVALGIYRTLQEKIEDAQFWFTSYSFEDLTSDEIGFYLALEFNLNDNLNIDVNRAIKITENDQAWNWLAEKCGFNKDRQEAIELSQGVYDDMGGFGGLLWDTPHVYEWGSPMIFGSCTSQNACVNGGYGTWPAEFKLIPPTSGNRNSLWWEYDSIIDGPLFESSYSGFSYLRKDN
ncbi:MAG: hypothetical protein IPJ47_12520 [Anaerolineales bacterium]|nr:hypothetical protein [Anaerolineales bacterium]